MAKQRQEQGQQQIPPLRYGMTTKGRATATGLTTADPLRDDNQTSKGNGNVKSKTIVVKIGAGV
jgi:hypothetical protein